jgi:hypothetical protein
VKSSYTYTKIVFLLFHFIKATKKYTKGMFSLRIIEYNRKLDFFKWIVVLYIGEFRQCIAAATNKPILLKLLASMLLLSSV